MSKPSAQLLSWFQAKGYTPWKFQTDTWKAYAKGESGLIHVATGSGKTLAAFGGPLSEVKAKAGLQILYISPLRAVIRDIEKAVVEIAGVIDPNIIIETKTGDTSSKVRSRQTKRLPDILLTTPESFNLLLTRADFKSLVKNVKCVILDEWHELMSSKRGLQVELALSHLLPEVPEARVWAMSGTIANLEESAQVAVGMNRKPVIISHVMKREVKVTTQVPNDPMRLPWTGHLGLRMLNEVLESLNEEVSTLVFTNTRSQAEMWYQAILEARPMMAGAMALHHSSLDMKTRLFVEDAVKSGEMKWVVCTSSLDLGVDFGPVEKVIQIGSAKGVARMIQRAGRANHRPNESAELIFVPTQAMEVAEIVALKTAILRTAVEPRRPFKGAIDVLEQHIVSCACGAPIDAEQIYQEVTQCYSYADLSKETFDWTVNHLTSGGVLHHYSQFKKLVRDEDGKIKIASSMLARFHKLSIGTIVADSTIGVFLANRRKIGNVEERYLARMKKGDKFIFAGRTLEFIMMKDMKAYVRPAKGKATQTPRWLGGKLPISEAVCHELREVLHRAHLKDYTNMSESEYAALKPVFNAQEKTSQLPLRDQFLIEFSQSREGEHAFLFPFEGRLVHEGMAALLAYRLTRIKKGTFGLSVNDYGIEILSESSAYGLKQMFEEHAAELWGEEGMLEDLARSIQLGEYSRRHFREIARVAGLVFQGYPGAQKSQKQMHMSSSLLFDVLHQHEPQNLLLNQAQSEVLERQFEATRMKVCMDRIRQLKSLYIDTPKFSPLAFPLVYERMAATLSSESLAERLERMKKAWVS